MESGNRRVWSLGMNSGLGRGEFCTSWYMADNRGEGERGGAEGDGPK